MNVATALRTMRTPAPNTTYAQRQPTAEISSWARGGKAKVPTLAPLEARPIANPRRRANHFTTVALQGTYALPMPIAATSP